MTHSLRILQQEHKNLGSLLDVLDEQILDIEAGHAPDDRLLKSVADYLSGYPDEVHHPKEDLIFRKMEQRDASIAAKLSRLIEEHRKLHELTSDFAAAVGGSSGQTSSRTSHILVAMKNLADYYRHHIEMEEKHFFPAALRVLNDEDWAEINFAVSEQADPLLDEAIEKHHAVRDRIFKIRNESRRQHDIDSKLTLNRVSLERLTDLSQFEQLMKEGGIDARLERDDSGGYRLITGSVTVFEIPPCTESRASWCAYCYLIGKANL